MSKYCDIVPISIPKRITPLLNKRAKQLQVSRSALVVQCLLAPLGLPPETLKDIKEDNRNDR